MRKKGIVLPETLKIIIAILCILLLMYLAVSVYGLFFKKTAIEQAKESLKQMNLEIEKVEKAEKVQGAFLLESPNKWYLMSFPYKDGIETPQQCKKYCICICPSATLKDCSTMGACIDTLIKPGLYYDAPIYIKGPTQLEIILSNNQLLISQMEVNKQ